MSHALLGQYLTCDYVRLFSSLNSVELVFDYSHVSSVTGSYIQDNI